MKKLFAHSAISFILLMGLVSLLSDMTHEGARSIYGVFLSATGASAAAIGFVSGFGELLGNALILVTGYIADKTHKYWLMTFIGYGINLLVIPALALVPDHGWILACGLLMVERIGRAIRKPSKSAMVSFASKEVGEGKTFAFLEFVDQIGAFLGPVLLFVVLWLNRSQPVMTGYRLAFLQLSIPALLTLIVLWIAFKKYPNPSQFEKEPAHPTPWVMNHRFMFYLVAIAFFAFGFIDFPLITLHLSRLELFDASMLPLVYAFAMIVDAFAALIFGWFYDKIGIRILIISTLLSLPFVIFIFSFKTLPMVLFGVVCWGIGMGAQESILKAVVATIVPKANRSLGFGVFELVFGLAWFLGSWLTGALYDINLSGMILLSVTVQVLSIPFFWLSSKK